MKTMSYFLFFLLTVVLLKADDDFEVLKTEVCRDLYDLDGWCTEEKTKHFMDLIYEVKPDIYVEIGVFAGQSLIPAAMALKYIDHGKAIAIDAWDSFECIKYMDPIVDRINIGWWGQLYIEPLYQEYVSLISKYRLDEYVHTIRSSSQKAVSLVDSIDILHIDGDHSQYGSLQDVILYLPKVRSGGYIWYSDALWIQRQKGLEILLKECEVVKTIDQSNCILFRKLQETL